MEVTIKVDDREGPFVIELLRKFSFIEDIRTDGKPISSNYTDELWQRQAEKLFKTKTDFDRWLNAPNSSIDGRKPLQLLANDAGYETVKKLLGRLEHGIMA